MTDDALFRKWMQFPYSAKLWKVGGKLLRRWWPLKGMWVDLDFTSRGIIISGSTESFWRHPWQNKMVWEQSDPDIKNSPFEWHAYVWPGLVNGRDVFVTGKAGHDPVALTDQDAPFLSMSWRDPLASAGVGVDINGDFTYAPAEGYPEFFKSLGVMPPAPGGDSGNAPDDPAKRRRIVACDIALQTPRVSAVATADINPDGSADFSTVFKNDAASLGPHRLIATSKWVPPTEPSPFDFLMGSAVQPSTDELHISTVWMVSPPGFPNDQPVDGSWSDYSQYFQYWNLRHACPHPPPQIPDSPIHLVTGLAGGAADAIIAALLEKQNDEFERVTQFLNSNQFPGQYWTA